MFIAGRYSPKEFRRWGDPSSLQFPASGASRTRQCWPKDPTVWTHGLDSPAAKGFPWQGTQIIKSQSGFAVVPSFHQLSSPILCFPFFWESSALFNKKKGLLRYTQELMIDSDFFNNATARQVLSTHSTQRMPWRREQSCKVFLLRARD